MCQKVYNTVEIGGTFTVPAGVTSVRVYPTNLLTGLPTNRTQGGWFGALTSTGAAYAWGLNTNGGLGVGDVTPRSSPVAVLGSLLFQKIAGGNLSSRGLTGGGAAYGWGLNAFGELGTGDVTPRSSPVAVLGGFTFVDIAASEESTVAITAAGAAYAWGRNSSGELGTGDVTPRSSPVAVLGGFVFVKISCATAAGSAGSSYGLNYLGAAYAWGGNANGQLGLGDVTPRSSPVAVLGGFAFKQITGGAGTSVMGLSTAGAAYGWGANTSGQLGTGDVTPRSSPVAVLGGLVFTKIASGNGHYLGITAAGVAYAWGGNANGQLGLGDVTPRSSPVAVLGSLVFREIGGGTNTAYGITTSGVLYAWGANSNGELGLGDVTPRSSPVAVLGSLAVELLANGNLPVTITVVPAAVYTVVTTEDITKLLFGGIVIPNNGQSPLLNVIVEYDQ